MPVIREYSQKLKSFSRNAKLFLAAHFLSGIGFGLNQVILNLYLREVGLDRAFLGSRSSMLALAAVIFALLAGKLSDRLGRRLSLLLGSIMLSVGVFAEILFPVKSVINLAVWFEGAANSLMMVSQNPFLLENSSPKERQHLFGVCYALRTVAGVVGSLLGGNLPKLYSTMLGVGVESAISYRGTLITGTLIAMLTVIPLFLLTEGSIPNQNCKNKRGKRITLSNPKLVLKFALPHLCLGIGAGLVVPFFNIFFREHLGATSSQIGFIFSWQAMITAVATLIAPLLAMRLGKIKSIVMSGFSAIPFMFVMALNGNLWVVAFAAWMRAASANAGIPIVSNFRMEVAPEHERATISSIMSMCWYFGWATGSKTAGFIIENYSYTLPYYGTIFFYGMSATLYWLFFRNYEQNIQNDASQARSAD